MYFITIKKTKTQNQTLGDLGFVWAEEAAEYVGSKVMVMREPKVSLAWMGR